MKEVELLYRYRDVFIFTSTIGGYHDIVLNEYPIIKETECGYWIEFDNKKGKKWVNKFAINAFAHKSIRAASSNYKHRKLRQLKILKTQIRVCQEFINKSKDF